MNTKVIYLGRNTSGVYLEHSSPLHIDESGNVMPLNSGTGTMNRLGHGNPYPVSLNNGQVVKLTIQIEQVPQYIPGKWYLGRGNNDSEKGTAACYHYDGTDFCRSEDRRTTWAQWSADELILSTTPIEHPFLEGQQ